MLIHFKAKDVELEIIHDGKAVLFYQNPNCVFEIDTDGLIAAFKTISMPTTKIKGTE